MHCPKSTQSLHLMSFLLAFCLFYHTHLLHLFGFVALPFFFFLILELFLLIPRKFPLTQLIRLGITSSLICHSNGLSLADRSQALSLCYIKPFFLDVYEEFSLLLFSYSPITPATSWISINSLCGNVCNAI